MLTKGSWRGLRFYPPVVPDDNTLKQWSKSAWPEYDAWLSKYALTNIQDWQSLRQQSLKFRQPPRFTIITPVYNTGKEILAECILSVRTQAYPFWEFILVDDASSCSDTHAILNSALCGDSRIHCAFEHTNTGISSASNRALAMAHGDYLIFLDHDDRLSPDALFYIATAIQQDQDIDIVYSDRDMLSPDGKRYMHLMKPDWSPETLLSGNYIFHLMCYRRIFLQQLGGLRSKFDGSQDYDLVLRAAERNPRVNHVSKVLYNWRQHDASVAFEPEAKAYAFKAGQAALQSALKRRNISAKATEIEELWRGNYEVDLELPNANRMALVRIDDGDNYGDTANASVIECKQASFIVILGSELVPLAHEAIRTMASYLQLDSVGMVTGKVVDAEKKIVHAGLFNRPCGIPFACYEGFAESEAGYLAVTKIMRNISAPHPYCVGFRRDVWDSLNGFDANFSGPYALLDFALRALHTGYRCVYTPAARFRIGAKWRSPEGWSNKDLNYFKQRWATWLETGDPYYSPHLTLKRNDMSLQ